MADHVYRRFTRENLFTTTILAQNQVYVAAVQNTATNWLSGAYFTNLPSNTLSLYGGVRSRGDVGATGTSGVTIYPLDQVDTQSIDGVIQVPGQYPQTGSINLVLCTNDEQPNALAITDTRWYDDHWAPINILSDWHSSHNSKVYNPLDTLPTTMSLVHIPAMFYGRTIATGSVKIMTRAWETVGGSNVLTGPPYTNPWSYSLYGTGPFGSGTFGGSAMSGVRYYVDDGYGRLFDVPVALTGNWFQAWSSGTAYRIGSVFYNEGLILFTHPEPTWHREFLSASYNDTGDTGPTFSLQFNGSYPIKSMIALCRMNPAEVNASNNPTYYYTDETGKRWARNAQGFTEAVTYTTAIGIYNEERQLVAVGKMAQPIRKREQDDIDIKLRLDL